MFHPNHPRSSSEVHPLYQRARKYSINKWWTCSCPLKGSKRSFFILHDITSTCSRAECSPIVSLLCTLIQLQLTTRSFKKLLFVDDILLRLYTFFNFTKSGETPVFSEWPEPLLDSHHKPPNNTICRRGFYLLNGNSGNKDGPRPSCLYWFCHGARMR